MKWQIERFETSDHIDVKGSGLFTNVEKRYQMNCTSFGLLYIAFMNHAIDYFSSVGCEILMSD